MTSNYSDTEDPGQSEKGKQELEQAKKNLEKQHKEEEEIDTLDKKSNSAVPNVNEIEITHATNRFIKRKMVIHELERKHNDLKALTFFKILKGFRFLMNRRDQKNLNSIKSIINHSNQQMRHYKLK